MNVILFYVLLGGGRGEEEERDGKSTEKRARERKNEKN